MNTKTILNIKTEKKLKKAAQQTAKELGVPLSTAINAFLKQFVREKELILSANTLVPTPYLERILKEAEEDWKTGKDYSGPFTADEFIGHLKKL